VKFSTVLRETRLIGALCATVGVISAVTLMAWSSGSGYEMFLLAAPLSAYLTGALCWWWLLLRNERHGIGRAMLAGALAGLIAHYPCWLILMFGMRTCYLLGGTCTGSLNEAPMTFLEAIPMAGLYSGFSLLFLGWITVPGGAMVGWLAAKLQFRPDSEGT